MPARAQGGQVRLLRTGGMEEKDKTALLAGQKELRQLRSKNILWQNYASLSRSRSLSLGRV